MSRGRGIGVREAAEQDVPAILAIVRDVYGGDYPYQRFSDADWLKKSVFTDDILMLVAVEDATEKVLGTASVVFDAGAHTDLIGEFGRLAVHPEERGRGAGTLLMQKRVELVKNRLHVAVVENRCVHPFSQRISAAHGFVPVGFLPLKHRFRERESIALFVRHFGAALGLRDNHPRIVPEAHSLAHMALANCKIPYDAIVDEDSAPYPHDDSFLIEELTAEGHPALLRIERGRVRNREVFGPMRLQYGFFKLTARQATYLIAREDTGKAGEGPIAGAIGYIKDDIERSVRVFELIARTDNAVRAVLEALLKRCAGEWGVEYVEIDVSAHAPRMQRTALELGFLPAAYVPAMVFHDVERLDVVRMSLVLVPPRFSEVQLTAGMQRVADQVIRSLTRQAVLPRVADAVHRLDLFSGLNDEQSVRVATTCTVAEFDSGSQLFHDGDEAGHMYLIIEGRVGIALGEPSQPVGGVEPGELLGEVSMLTGEPHSASAVAEGQVVAAALSRRDLGDLTRRRPDIGLVLYRNLAVGLCRKLQRADARVSEHPSS